MNFKSNKAYKKWLAYGHASGEFAKTPGHQSVSIKGKPKSVKHGGGGPKSNSKNEYKISETDSEKYLDLKERLLNTEVPSINLGLPENNYNLSNIYKYAFAEPSPEGFFGLATLGSNELGLEGTIGGYLPYDIKTNPYFKGDYFANVQKHFPKFSVGVGANKAIFGYPDQSGNFTREPSGITPNFNLRVNLEHGGRHVTQDIKKHRFNDKEGWKEIKRKNIFGQDVTKKILYNGNEREVNKTKNFNENNTPVNSIISAIGKLPAFNKEVDKTKYYTGYGPWRTKDTYSYTTVKRTPDKIVTKYKSKDSGHNYDFIKQIEKDNQYKEIYKSYRPWKDPFDRRNREVTNRKFDHGGPHTTSTPTYTDSLYAYEQGLKHAMAVAEDYIGSPVNPAYYKNIINEVDATPTVANTSPWWNYDEFSTYLDSAMFPEYFKDIHPGLLPFGFYGTGMDSYPQDPQFKKPVKPPGTIDPNISVDVRFRKLGLDSSFVNRKKIAEEMAGIENYKGTPEQNDNLNKWVVENYNPETKTYKTKNIDSLPIKRQTQLTNIRPQLINKSTKDSEPQGLTKQKTTEDYYFDPRLDMYVKRRKVKGAELTGTDVGGRKLKYGGSIPNIPTWNYPSKGTPIYRDTSEIPPVNNFRTGGFMGEDPPAKDYSTIPGVNKEKLTQWNNLNKSEPTTVEEAKLLAEAVGYTPQQAIVVAAQWALESGRGKNTGGDYNYFGIKSHNQAVRNRMSDLYGLDLSAANPTATSEYEDGKNVTTTSSFMNFANPIEAFLGHKAFLETNNRYADALSKTTSAEFAQGLQKAGYATAPNYSKLLRDIAVPVVGEEAYGTEVETVEEPVKQERKKFNNTIYFQDLMNTNKITSDFEKNLYNRNYYKTLVEPSESTSVVTPEVSKEVLNEPVYKKPSIYSNPSSKKSN